MKYIYWGLKIPQQLKDLLYVRAEKTGVKPSEIARQILQKGLE